MFQRRNFLLGAASLAALSACKPEYPRASIEAVRANRYYAGPPYSISLLSMVSENTENSEHSGLLINGSQRVIYDPAGTYWTHQRPRRHDIHYGMNDVFVEHYESFHARLGFFVERATVQVPLEIADLAIRKAEERGETIFTQCAVSAGWVLRQLPGFESIPVSMGTDRLRRAFKRLPNVTIKITREDDIGQNLREITVEGFDPDDIAPPVKPEDGRGDF